MLVFCYFFSDNKKANHVIVLLVLVCIYFLVNLQLFYMRSILFFLSFFSLTCISEGGNLAASKIRNLECPSYEICLIDYGCGKFNRKIHIMEQYP